MTDTPTPRRKRSELKHEDEIALVHTLEPWGRLKNIGDRIQMLKNCTTTIPQPDLSDEGLMEMAASMYGRVVTYKDEYLVGLLRSVRDQARMENMEQIKAARVVARLAGIQEGFDIAAPDALKESERALADAEHRLREIYKVTLQKRDNEGVWLRTIQGLAEESRRAAEEGGKDA